MDNTYAKSFSEVYVIINILDEKIRSAIPKSFINFIENNRDTNYSFKYDYDKPIDEQKLSNDAQSILAIIYRNYICTEAERKELDTVLRKNDEQFEKNLYENIFNTQTNNTTTPPITQNVEESAQLVEYKENILTKLIKKFKSFFRKEKKSNHS